jgi:hypothetical protein
MAAPVFAKDFFSSNYPKPVKTYHREPYPRLDPSKSSFNGAGKTVLVTGGGKKISGGCSAEIHT